MVVRRDGDGAICIGQPSHAWLSGQLARAWGNELFGTVEPWEEACLAAEQHDLGMAAWDLRPTLNPETGLPHSFIEMPLDAHLEIWSHAAERLLPQSRYAALLVSMHGSALYGMRDLDEMPDADAAKVRAFLDEWAREQERLQATLDADPAEVRRNQRLVWTWDYLSLAICLDWVPGVAKRAPTATGETDVRVEPAGRDWRVIVDPWPFAGESLIVRCEGRRLGSTFDDEETMRAALAAAPWVDLECELVPA